MVTTDPGRGGPEERRTVTIPRARPDELNRVRDDSLPDADALVKVMLGVSAVALIVRLLRRST